MALAPPGVFIMFNTILYFSLYFSLCFAASAFVVRFAPNLVTARIIRVTLAATLALPLLLLVDVLALAGRTASGIAWGLRRLFEILSGRKLRQQYSIYYGYQSRSSRRRGRA